MDYDMDTLEADFELSRLKGAENARESQRLKETDDNSDSICNGDETLEDSPLQVNGKTANGDEDNSNSSSILKDDDDDDEINGDNENETKSLNGNDDDEIQDNDKVSEVDTDSRSAQATPMETDEDSKESAPAPVTNDEDREEDVQENDDDDKEDEDKGERADTENGDSRASADSNDTKGSADAEEELSGQKDVISGSSLAKYFSSTNDSSASQPDKSDQDKGAKDEQTDRKSPDDSAEGKEADVDKEADVITLEEDEKEEEEAEEENKKTPPPPPAQSKVMITVSDSPVAPATTGVSPPASSNNTTSVMNLRPDNKVSKVLPVTPKKAPAAAAAPPTPPSDSLRPMAKSLYDLGLDLARQQVYKDLIKIQSKKQTQSKLGDKEQKQLDKLKVAYDNIVSKNEPYEVDMFRCDLCGFNTESPNVMELHKEYAHHSKDGNNFKCECSFCDFECSFPGDFFIHMEKEHKKRGRIHMRLANHVCPHCPFENNSKKSYQAHMVRCERNFRIAHNLQPTHADSDIPLIQKKTKEPAKVSSLVQNQKRSPFGQPSQLRPATRVNELLRQAVPPRQPAAAPRAHVINPSLGMKPGSIMPVPAMAPGGQQLFQVGNQLYTLVHNQGQAFLTPYLQGTTIPSLNLPQQRASVVTAAAGATLPPPPPPLRQQPPSLRTQAPPPQTQTAVSKHAQKSVADLLAVKKGSGVLQKPGIGQAITKSQANQPAGASSGFEICEICGGFVKDRESLRIHFFYAHKVEIPLEIFRNKQPHLLCEVCKQRFWTYQGMVRHTQLVHESKSKVVGAQCSICGEKNLPMGLLGHLVARHNVSIRKLIEANKCFLCKARFPVHFLLKVHMTKTHGDVIGSTNVFNAFMKSLGLSKAFMPVAGKETTDQPVPTGLFENAGNLKGQKKTPGKDKKGSVDYVEVNPAQHPYKCSRCSRRFPFQEILQKHYQDTHRFEKEQCMFCQEKVLIGRPYIRHMKREHCGECSVVVKRLPKKEFDFYLAKRKRMEEEERLAATVVLDNDEDDMPLAKRLKTLSASESGEKKGDESDKENNKDAEDVVNDAEDVVVDQSESGKAGDDEDEEKHGEGEVNDEEKMDTDEVQDTQDTNQKEDVGDDKETDSFKTKPEGEIIEFDGETIVVQKQEED